MYICTNLLLAMIKLEAVMKTHSSSCNKERMTTEVDIYVYCKQNHLDCGPGYIKR